MALLKEEISNRGITGGIDTPNEDITIPVIQAEEALTLVSMFGALASQHPQLTHLINIGGPMLFAALLVTLCEDYQVDPKDDNNLLPGNTPLEAENAAIGYVRAVSSAFGAEDGSITCAPSDAEVDADTDLVNPT